MKTLWSGVFSNVVSRNLVNRIVLFLWLIVVIVIQELEGASMMIENGGWPWSEAVTTEDKNINGKLAVVVIWRTNGDHLHALSEWQNLEEGWIHQRTVGDEIEIGCRMINGTAHEKATGILVKPTSKSGQQEGCIRPGKLDCWYNFILTQTVAVNCFWTNNGQKLEIKEGESLMINFTIYAILPTTVRPPIALPSPTTYAQAPVKLEPKIYETGPYVVRNTGQQQLLFNPEWSLKRVELLIQINISAVQPACSPFLKTSLEGWTIWSQKQVHLRGRTQRDLTGMLGTGLGVLNGIDSEILMNKLATATSDLTKLKQPLQSSLLALGTSQWQVSKVLPIWEKAEDQDHRLIIDALSMAQDNVSLALSCIQVQLWMQATAALIIREGSEGIFPAEVRKIVWDNANDFEKKFQSWWTLVNFTYDPIINMATAFVLTIRNATVYVIHPIVALGLNHEETVLYPSEHRTWARMKNGKWQSVNLESCVTREQQGFICESNTIDAQDVCLDTEQGVCHFEIHPNTSQKTVLVYIGQGCVCLRTACAFVEVDEENITLPSKNHSNFCICNFVRIIGCDFLYSAPVVSHQLIKSNHTMYHKLLPTPIGMNLTLVKQLLKHQDLIKILKGIQEDGEKTLITVHHDTKEINRVLQRVKQDTDHSWWDKLFGWSPTATGILNTLCHPIIVLLMLVGISLILSFVILVWNWKLLQRMAILASLTKVHGKVLRDTYRRGWEEEFLYSERSLPT
ncbi:LOW QUALITY PROTEIN: uncharacterized protein [Anser cygnoides]|uniref:LOW QUALITY PROTEIN: uncharacterized protein n=1 Tax=Anser cygnoides TaxID=8845 RepID=UPI0034D24911